MSESDFDDAEFFATFARLDDDEFPWADFGDLPHPQDTSQNSPPAYQHPPPAHSHAPAGHPQQPYQNMPPGRNASSSDQRFDFDSFITISSDSGPDRFRPLPCNSERRRSSRSSSKIIDLTADSPPLASMAKRKLTGAAATAHATKRQRLVAAKSRHTSRASTDAPSTKIEILDLIDVENYESHETQQKRAQREKEALAVQMAKEEAEKPVRLAQIECVVCLDNPTDLVVTHCGHLFCSLCLHHTLEQSGPGGSGPRCPSCRAKIVTRPAPSGKENKQSFYPLGIKLKVSTKSGKKKAS